MNPDSGLADFLFHAIYGFTIIHYGLERIWINAHCTCFTDWLQKPLFSQTILIVSFLVKVIWDSGLFLPGYDLMGCLGAQPLFLPGGLDLGTIHIEFFQAVLSETRSQQAASMTDFYWLGCRFPITNAKTRVSILKAQQLERDLKGGASESIAAEKKLAIFDKIFSAYHDARSCIRNDLASAGNAENIRDDLNGLDKAVSAVLGLRTIERNQLLVSIAKSKFTKHRDEKNEKITKPEELVRLYDLLIQNTTDLTDLVSSGRNKNEEENSFVHEYELKGLAFRAERCFFLAKSYSSAGKRAEAYALFCHARSLSDSALQQLANSPDKVLIQDLKSLSDNCRSSSCIEHATGIMEEESVPLKLSKGVSTMSLADDKTRENKYLLDMLDIYESAVAEPNTKAQHRIAQFPPPFQAVPCNPIVLDMAYNAVEFPSLENRMKKEKKGLLSRFWG
ncbi:hypothetical protein PR202_gb29318 [Eleusine coracana subsp. coracana]|uniref:Signal recognition particle subunit SRP68 n=1 Tax=Eleusine coracana subsp. coracana TaxID=191504 RepID=A0AAV5FYS5_ELECO|nr:hypothetical protein PR202_gb29318 [Eleusine coracana subsp. coracana]